MTRWALGVEYDGSCFHGFQRQPHTDLPTVQGCLEAALSRVADHPVTLVCAGRTDTGVHATGQVIHFDTASERPRRAWLRGINSLTPDGVCVHWAQQVDEGFHARFSARWRRYVYLGIDGDQRQALLRDRVARLPGPLDDRAMDAGAAFLVGEQDFTSFRAANCQARHAVRDIQAARVRRRGPLVALDIRANAFLQHMVRNIMGALLCVGRGERPPEWIAELITARDRTQGGVAAPPEGLYLVAVGFDADVGLPSPATPLMPFALLG